MHRLLMPMLFLFLWSSADELRGQIIADHRVVDLYDDIPPQYMDSVKQLLVFMAGESHSGAYRVGQELLELLDPDYQVETFTTNPPPDFSDDYLRIGMPYMIGESSFFSQSAIDNLKAHITYQNNAGNPYDVMGFGWCWDMTWNNAPGGGEDPVYHVRWAGSSQGGPDGNQRWGLDADDYALTGNRVCMDTYLQAVDEYNAYCKANKYPTRWVFTTGPVDGNSNNGTEQGFQREIKQDYIREYVLADTSRILFDYADILCWNNAGEKHMADWDDEGTIRSHAQIHPDNLKDYDESWNEIPFSDEDQDHIGEVGAVRLAKAMWWMLARMAGWEPEVVSVRENMNRGVILNGIDDGNISLIISKGLLGIRMLDHPADGEICLYSLSGQPLAKQNITGNSMQFETGALPQGLYVLAISSHSAIVRTGIFFLP